MRKAKMSKRKKRLDDIGKNYYDFDFGKEEAIYTYLCCKRVKRKEIHKLDNDLKFNYYRDWKNYVEEKYKKCRTEKLIEFSRYLNQKIRDISPDYEYWKLSIPVILSVLIMGIIDIVDGILKLKLPFSVYSIIILMIIIILFLALPTLYAIWTTMIPLWDNNHRKSFLIDYKEIIDQIIGEKEEL